MGLEQAAVDEFIKWLVGLGVGGAIAAFIFTFYRKDVKQYTTLWEVMSKQLIEVVKDNTASNVRLIALIETQERNTIRKQDLEQMIEIGIRNRLIELSWPRAEPPSSDK